MNYFSEPFTEDSLTALIRKTGMRPYDLLRLRDPQVGVLGITDKTKDADVVRHMIDHPSLLQRPIVELRDRAVLARPIEAALDLIRKML